MSSRAILSLAALACVLTAGAPALAQGSAAPAYIVQADVVSSGESKGVQGKPCVNQSVFFPGDTIVFRALVSDAAGQPLTRDEIVARGLKAVVTTSDGRTVALRFGVHPPPNVPVPSRGQYWSGSLPIPRSHPTGTLPWTLTVTDTAGHSVTYTPIGQANGIAVLTIAQGTATTP